MNCKCKPIYAKRKIMKQGNHYTRHVCHMTGEGLHDKSDIAAELAHRDITIERQQAALDAVRTFVAGLRRNSVPLAPPDAKAVWASDLETMIEEALAKANGGDV